MEIIDLDKQNRIIINDNIVLIQRRLFKQSFLGRDLKYFLFAWCFLLAILSLLLGFSWEYILSCIFISLLLLATIAAYFQIEELEINFEESVIKHRYIIFEKSFRKKTVLNQLEFIQFKLLPGEILTPTDNIAKSFELVGRKHHYPHVDLFCFLKKETALKLIPIFRDKLGIEIIDDLKNFQYLK